MPKIKLRLVAKQGDWCYYIKDSEAGQYHSNGQFMKNCLTADILAECPFHDKIFKDYDVAYIIVNGSYCNGAIDEQSDFDMSLHLNNTTIDDLPSTHGGPTEYISYKNKFIHWTYQPVEQILLAPFGVPILDYAGLMCLYNLDEQKILFIKDDPYDKKVLNNIIQNHKKIAKIGALLMLQTYTFLLKQYVYTEQLIWGKDLYFLLMCYYILHDTPFDYDLLVQTKRSSYLLNAEDEATIETRDQLKNILLNCFNYLLEYADKHQVLTSDFNEQLNQLTKEITAK